MTSTRGWIDGATTQIRMDIAIAKREIATMLQRIGTGSAFCALGATIGLLGALSLITGVILVMGDQWLPRDWYALGALIVAVIAGVATWAFIHRGLSGLHERH